MMSGFEEASLAHNKPKLKKKYRTNASQIMLSVFFFFFLQAQIGMLSGGLGNSIYILPARGGEGGAQTPISPFFCGKLVSPPLHAYSYHVLFASNNDVRISLQFFGSHSTPYCPQRPEGICSGNPGSIDSCHIPAESDSSRPLDSSPNFSTDCPPDCPPDGFPDSSPIGPHLHSAEVSDAAFCLQH